MRKIILLFKYSQNYASQLRRQNQAFEITGNQKVNFDKGVRWGSTGKFFKKKLIDFSNFLFLFSILKNPFIKKNKLILFR
jgi:hypothetical protein